MSNQHRALHAETVVATGDIAANRLVTYAGGQNTVAGGKVLGVAQRPAVAGEQLAVTTHGTAVVVAGADFAKGATLVSDNQGRVVAGAGALAVAAGVTGVTSSAANGAIIAGSDLPQAVVGSALQASGAAGDLVEVLLGR